MNYTKKTVRVMLRAGEDMKNDMTDFWNALITGLTPESPKQLGLWWKIPLIIVSGVVLIAIF